MIYENETLIDASNPDVLEIRTNNFYSKEFKNILIKECSNYGFKINKGTGEWFNHIISLDNKTISFYFRSNNITFQNNITLCEKIITFTKPVKKTSTLGSFSLNLAELKSELELKVEQSKLRKQNKNVSEFKYQMFAPYVDGIFNEHFPKCKILTRARFSYRIDFKHSGFHIYITTKEMTKLDFSLIDFDDILCNISIYRDFCVYQKNIKLGEIESFKNNLNDILNKLATRLITYNSEKTKREKEINKLSNELFELKANNRELHESFYKTTGDIW